VNDGGSTTNGWMNLSVVTITSNWSVGRAPDCPDCFHGLDDQPSAVVFVVAGRSPVPPRSPTARKRRKPATGTCLFFLFQCFSARPRLRDITYISRPLQRIARRGPAPRCTMPYNIYPRGRPRLLSSTVVPCSPSPLPLHKAPPRRAVTILPAIEFSVIAASSGVASR